MNNDKAIINIDIWLLLFCNYLDDIKLFSLKEKSKKILAFFIGIKLKN